MSQRTADETVNGAPDTPMPRRAARRLSEWMVQRLFLVLGGLLGLCQALVVHWALLVAGRDAIASPALLLVLAAGFTGVNAALLPAMRARRRDDAVRFCLAWAVPTWIAFELAATKLPHYLLPVFPALAILAAGAATAAPERLTAKGVAGSGLLAVWVLGGAAVDLGTRTGRSGGLGQRLGRLRRLPGADWGKAIAHAGLGVTTIGIAGLMAWQVQDIRVAQIGDRYSVAGWGPWQYDIRLNDVRRVEGPNYGSTMAEIDVLKGDRVVAQLTPEKRVYPVAGMPTTEASIDSGVFRDVYLVIGDPQTDGGWAVRTFVKPLANWIWGGSILMAIGGLASMADRRYRVAAGGAKAGRPIVPGGVPAE